MYDMSVRCFTYTGYKTDRWESEYKIFYTFYERKKLDEKSKISDFGGNNGIIIQRGCRMWG